MCIPCLMGTVPSPTGLRLTHNNMAQKTEHTSQNGPYRNSRFHPTWKTITIMINVECRKKRKQQANAF